MHLNPLSLSLLPLLLTLATAAPVADNASSAAGGPTSSSSGDQPRAATSGGSSSTGGAGDTSAPTNPPPSTDTGPQKDTLTLQNWGITNGVLNDGFNVFDYKSTVHQGRCRVPSDTASWQPGVWMPCEPRSYQYKFMSFQSAREFTVGVGHTIERPPNGTQIKEATFTFNIPAEMGDTVMFPPMVQPALNGIAPAGWKGDAFQPL